MASVWETIGYKTFKSQNGSANFCLAVQTKYSSSGTDYTVETQEILLTTQSSASFYNCKQNVSLTGNNKSLHSGTTNVPKTSSAWDTSLKQTIGGVNYVKGVVLISSKSFVVSGLGTNISIPIKGTYENTWSEAWAPTKGTTYTASGNLSLPTLMSPTIPTLSATSVTLGNPVTITMNNAVSSAKHDLKVNINGSTYTLATKTGSSFVWNTLESYAENFPNASEVNCTITCDTYNGTTKVGTKTVSIKLVVPDTMIPSANFTMEESNPKLIGKNIGAFVQNLSQIKFNINAQGVKKSTIKSYSANIAGIPYSGQSFTTNIITTLDKSKNKITVTDTRNKSKVLAVDYDILEYTLPIISGTVQRCDANGKPSNSGTKLLYSAKGSIHPLEGKNTVHTFKIGYKEKDEDNYTYKEIINSLSLDTGKESIMLQDVNFETNKSYDIVFVAEDLFNIISHKTDLPVKKVIMNATPNGSLSIGEVIEEEGEKPTFNVAMDTLFKGEVKTLTGEVLSFVEVDSW